MADSSRRGWVEWLPVAVIFGVALVARWLVAERGWLADDAFITFRYAAKLAGGHGFVYNDGERVLGTTAPLLTGLLALAGRLGLDIPAAGKWLALLASAACCALVFDIVRVQTGKAVGGLVGAAVLLCSTSQADIAASGMETALLGALMLGSYRLLLARRPGAGGALAGLAAVTRPEGLAWLVLTLPFLRGERSWRWPAVALALGPVAAWAAFATAYFGSPVPQSAAMKALQGAQLGASPSGMLHALLTNWAGWMIPLGLVVGALWLAWRPAHRLLLAPAGFVATFAAAYMLYHPNLYFWYRGPFDVALTLLMGIVAGASVQAVEEDAQPSSPETWRLGWMVAVLLTVVLLVQTQSRDHLVLLARRPGTEPHLELARWLNAQTRPGQSILVGDVGYVGYHSLDRIVHDYHGLVWRAGVADMARVGLPAQGGGLVWWVAERLRPDVVACPPVPVAGQGAPPGYRQVPGAVPGGYSVFVRSRRGP